MLDHRNTVEIWFSPSSVVRHDPFVRKDSYSLSHLICTSSVTQFNLYLLVKREQFLSKFP